jgi:hypothetical protein
MYAAMYGDLQDLRLLLERGARPNEQKRSKRADICVVICPGSAAAREAGRGLLREGALALLIAAGPTGTEKRWLSSTPGSAGQLTSDSRRAVAPALPVMRQWLVCWSGQMP